MPHNVKKAVSKWDSLFTFSRLLYKTVLHNNSDACSRNEATYKKAIRPTHP